jgi:CRISPR-associated RAMP protein, Csm4 family
VKLITLKFTSPYSIGERENHIDAITLYRALIKALTLLEEPFDEIKNGEVKFSSTFPVVNGKLYLKIPYRIVKCTDRDKEKMLKKIEYIDADIFKKVSPPYTLECENDVGYLVGDGEKVKLDSNFLQSYGESVVQYKNRMDRVNNSADIYSTSSFIPNTPVGFLATGWNNRLEKALKLLEKLGIGKDRNLGYGRFTVQEVKDIDLTLPNREYKYVTGRAYTEGEYLSEKLERAQIIGGDMDAVLHSILVLLPVGSLIKETKRIVLEKNNNIVIVDPIAL